MALPEWQALANEACRRRRARQPARAIECLLRAIEITKQFPDLVRETATSLNYLAAIYREERMLAESEAAARQAIEWCFRLPPDSHFLAASDYMILADVLSLQGRHREALEAGQQGLVWHQRSNVPGDFLRQIKERVKQLRRNLAQAEAGGGRPAYLGRIWARLWNWRASHHQTQ